MKKMFSSKNYSYAMLVSLLLLMSGAGYGQYGVNGIGLPPPTPACTYCSNTTVSSTKFASTLGIGTVASDSAAFASGYFSQATGYASSAFGYYSIASGTKSYAIGNHVESTNSGAIAIGNGVLSSGVKLTNSHTNSIMFGSNSNYPTLFISSSAGSGYTGTIGIGNITLPQAKLHIYGDDNSMYPDNASLYIQSAGDYYSTIWLADKSHHIKTKVGEDLEFNAAGQDFYFNNGDVGIGTDTPQSELDVDGRFTTENLTITNNSASGRLLQSDANGNASWVDAGASLNWRFNRDSTRIMTNYGGGFSVNSSDTLYGPLQIGKEFTFYGASINENKLVANNFHWFTADIAKRINDGTAGMLKFEDESGKIFLHTAGYGTTSENIAWEKMVFTPSGRLGVGIADPEYQLDVRGDSIMGAYFHSSSASASTVWVSNSQHSFGFGVDGSGKGHIYGDINGANLMTFASNKVLVGDTTEMVGNHKLYVNGSILSTEINVAEVANWADYVFDDDYELPALSDVELFVNKNKHLPDIPSETEVKENGINLGEMDALLLKKIEELTLYTIEQQKMLEEQRAEIDKLKAELSK